MGAASGGARRQGERRRQGGRRRRPELGATARMSAETDLRARLIAERENVRTADEIVAAVSPAPTPGVANGARYVVALPFPRGANGGTRGTRSTSPSRRGSVDKCSRPSRSVAIAGVRRAVTRYPQVPPAQARPPAPALVVPRCCVRAFRVARTCAPHLAGALVVVGWAAPLRAGLIAELGDGAAGRPGKRCQWCRAVPDHPRPPCDLRCGAVLARLVDLVGGPGASTGRRCGCGARWRSACRPP